jgi:O-antigen/teichoic acid export membrane protein
MQSFTLTIKNAASRLLSDTNFSFLLRSSSFNAGIKIIGTAFGFLASFLVARTYGPGMVGTIAAINSTFMLLSLCALFGNQIHIVKILPEHIENRGYYAAWETYKQFLAITIVLIVATLTIWSIIEAATPITLLKQLEHHTLLIAGLVALATYKRINTKTLRALGDYKIYSYFDLSTPLFSAIIAITAVMLNIPNYIFEFAYFTPHLVLCLLSFFIVKKLFNNKKNKDDKPFDNKNWTFLKPHCRCLA